ncbi:hypothetical protein [Clostridium beijerinckii]|uniref:hypothetical protein n=1 Tax=Clostridium beijerinckii TaxID=1520 RepID=UPI00156FE7CB|nr:hypothetical protein [Clostridium beijerinckii]NRZ12157.1 hypothetical protein [Clostridium beijerinckii]
MPSINQGRYSKYNVNGRIIKLKKLPKIDKTFSVDSPNFGDPLKGYHTTTFSRKVYQTNFIPPKFLNLVFELQDNSDNNSYLFKVYTDTILDKNSSSFEDDLLFHCNLLQENIMSCDVTDSSIVDKQYIEDLHVDWELLPPGEIKKNPKLFLNPKDYDNPKAYDLIKERLDFFENLGAINYIHGHNKFNSYKGALFPNDIVLLENYNYGNAIYIFKNNWTELTKLSRTELLNSHDENIVRVKHTSNWKNNVKNALSLLCS